MVKRKERIFPHGSGLLQLDLVKEQVELICRAVEMALHDVMVEEVSGTWAEHP